MDCANSPNRIMIVKFWMVPKLNYNDSLDRILIININRSLIIKIILVLKLQVASIFHGVYLLFIEFLF